jgi:hypothetical protein
MNVVMLALGANRQNAVQDDAAFLLDRGAEVTLVTTQAQKWPGLDPRTEVLELSAHESRHPVRYLEWLVVFRLPRVPFSLLGRVPGMRGKAAGLQRAYEQKLAWRFHRRIFERAYKGVRPLVLWRVARRRVLPTLDFAATDLLLVLDSASIPIAWHLARRHRDLTVTFSLDRSTVPAAEQPKAEATRVEAAGA